MQIKNSLTRTIQPLQLHKNASQQIQTQQASRAWILAKALVSHLPLVVLLWSTCWLLTGCDVPGGSLTPQPANLIGLANPGDGPNQAPMVNPYDLTVESSEKTFQQFFSERGASAIWERLYYCLYNTRTFGEIDETFLDNDRPIKDMLLQHVPEEQAELQAAIITYTQYRDQDTAFRNFLFANELYRIWDRLKQARRTDTLDLQWMLSNCTPATQSYILERVVQFIRTYLPHVVELDLSENRLTALPDSFGDLTQLQILNLACNQLTRLPDIFAKLKNLQIIYLTANKLTNLLHSLPHSFRNLTNLNKLYLGCNQLKFLPAPFQKLTNLTEFTVYGNPLLKPSDNFNAIGDLLTTTNLPTLLFPSLTELAAKRIVQDKTSYNTIGHLTIPDECISRIQHPKTYPVLLFIRRLRDITFSQPIATPIDLSYQQITNRVEKGEQVILIKQSAINRQSRQ